MLARDFGAHVTVNPSQQSPYDVLAVVCSVPMSVVVGSAAKTGIVHDRVNSAQNELSRCLATILCSLMVVWDAKRQWRSSMRYSGGRYEACASVVGADTLSTGK